MISFRFLQVVAQAEAQRGKRYTATELAEGMGVTRATVAQWLAMSQDPAQGKAITLESMGKICGFLDCQPADLFTWQPEAAAQQA